MSPPCQRGASTLRWLHPRWSWPSSRSHLVWVHSSCCRSQVLQPRGSMTTPTTYRRCYIDEKSDIVTALELIDHLGYWPDYQSLVCRTEGPGHARFGCRTWYSTSTHRLSY